MAYLVDVVHCRNCNASHGENEIGECAHCEKDVCPSCGRVDEPEDNSRAYGYHPACAAYEDGESDLDPAAESSRLNV